MSPQTKAKQSKLISILRYNCSASHWDAHTAESTLLPKVGYGFLVSLSTGVLPSFSRAGKWEGSTLKSGHTAPWNPLPTPYPNYPTKTWPEATFLQSALINFSVMKLRLSPALKANNTSQVHLMISVSYIDLYVTYIWQNVFVFTFYHEALMILFLHHSSFKNNLQNIYTEKKNHVFKILEGLSLWRWTKLVSPKSEITGASSLCAKQTCYPFWGYWSMFSFCCQSFDEPKCFN